jgi:O-6-methylguanine DNA methyltransferase
VVESPNVSYSSLSTPLGALWLARTGKGLCAIGLGPGQPARMLHWVSLCVSPSTPQKAPDSLAQARIQIHAYFEGTLRQFSLALDIRGTNFQRAVWAETCRIRYGMTATYGGIAARLMKPSAARAVGGALHANPLPIVIPCHRIVGSRDSLVGYAEGLALKAALLRHEHEGVLLADARPSHNAYCDHVTG